MASQIFETLDRTMRRAYWMNLVDEQLMVAHRQNFRASLVFNAYTGLPIVAEGSEPDVAGERLD